MKQAMHPDLCSHETCKLIGTSDKTSGRQHKQFLQVRAQVVCYRNRVAGHGGNDRTSNICLDPSQWDRPTTTGEHRKQASLTPTLDVHKPTVSGASHTDMENESIRANPASSMQRHIRKAGSVPNLRSGIASPERSRQTKQHVPDSPVDLPVPLHDSSPPLGLSKLRGPPGQPVPMQLGLQTAPEEHFQGQAASNDADSPGTPQQPDTAQFSADLLASWAEGGTSLQHQRRLRGETGPPSFDGDHLAQPEDGPSGSGGQAPVVARSEATPQLQRGVASASAQHDTPDGALVAGAATPDHPDDGGMDTSLAPTDKAKDVPFEALVPEEVKDGDGNDDVSAAELADVTLMWQTVERDSRLRGRRRARTSVTSLRSSGALEALLEDVKWQREAADQQLATARRDKAAAEEEVQHAGFEGFQIERGLLERLQAALSTAASATSDKEQIGDELEAAFRRITAAENRRLHLEQQLQAEAKVREATERALEAARSEVEALGAKARRAAKQRRRLLTRMEDISEGIQSPFITHGQSLHASIGGWPGSVAGASSAIAIAESAAAPSALSLPAQQRSEPGQAATVDQSMGGPALPADVDELFEGSVPPVPVSHAGTEWVVRSRTDVAFATPRREDISMPHVSGTSGFHTPPSAASSSWMRTPSQAVTNSAPRATSERRQRAREAQAEALAAEYDRTADSGYEEETDSGLTPSRLLLRLREARAAAAGAASGARRARAAASAAEARAAAAEAAEARLGAALTAAQQRAVAREEQGRRLQAQLSQAQLRLAQLRVQCDSMSKEKAGHSQVLKAAAAEVKDWEAKTASLQNQVERAEASAMRAAAEAAAAHERCCELEHAAVGREAAVQDASVRLEEGRTAQADLAARAGQAQDALEQLEQALEERTRAEAALQNELDQAHQQAAAMADDLRQQHETESALRRQLQQQELHRGALEAEVQQLRSEGNALKNEAEQHRERERALQAQLQALKAEREERVAKLEAELAELKSQCEQLESASGDLMDLRVAFKEREATIADLTAKLGSVRAEGAAANGKAEAVGDMEEAAEEPEREERSVEDAENRLVDVQIELMAAQYDARTAAEALTSAQEQVSDLSWHLEDSHSRLAELEASCSEASNAREAAEQRAAELEDQVAKAQARAEKLATKLKAHRRSSGESALLLQVEALQEDKRSAEAQAEALRLKLATVRREAAAREATITEEAAVHRAEAEAAAQLVAAMRPKGDNVLATLWTKLMEAHARAARAQLQRAGSGAAASGEVVDDEGAQKRLHEVWAQLETAKREAYARKQELAVTQAQLAATAAIPGHPDELSNSPEGAEQSASPDSPPESPEAAAQGTFQMDESPIRGLLMDSNRAAARRSERLAAAATAQEAAVAAAVAPKAAAEPGPPADLVAIVAAGSHSGGSGARFGGWTPRGSASSSGGSANAGCTVRLAGAAAAAPKASRSSASSSGSNQSLGRELERFACGSTPRQPQPPAAGAASSADALSEGAGSNMVHADGDPRAAGSGALLDVVYDLQGSGCGAGDTTMDDAASASSSPARPARDWVALRPADAPAAGRSGSAGSRMSTGEAMSLSRFVGHCYGQLRGGARLRSAAAGVSAFGGLLCIGLLLAARQRQALMAGFRFLLRIFRLYRATLLRLR